MRYDSGRRADEYPPDPDVETRYWVIDCPDIAIGVTTTGLHPQGAPSEVTVQCPVIPSHGWHKVLRVTRHAYQAHTADDDPTVDGA